MPALKKKCQDCRVARKRAGCLFGCTRKERLAREFQLLIQEANPGTDRITEQLRQCQHAFDAGHLLEQVFRTAADKPGEARILPPANGIVSPFV